jgi:hypothetical protein
VLGDVTIESRYVVVKFNDKPGESDVGKAMVSGGNVVLPCCSGYDEPLESPPVGFGLTDDLP